MLFQNGTVFLDGELKTADVRVKGKVIAQVGGKIKPEQGEKIVDIEGKMLLPGFVDVHTHGRDGADFSDASPEEINRIRMSYAACGVTSLLATTMTMEEEYTKQMLGRIRTAIERGGEGAHIWGINLEGPFLGPDKKGCHDPRYLKKPAADYFELLDECAGGKILLVDVDPCLEGALSFIKQYKGKKKLSIAHTSAGYKLANEAVDAGATHITHLFNAMNGLHHRETGVIGTFLDREIWAELICDGVHVDPSIVRMVFAAAGEKLCIISDSLSAAGKADGTYSLGGLSVTVKGNRATLEDGTLACSISNVFGECCNVIGFGVKAELAIAAATINPAKAMGLNDRIGAIAPGYLADLLVTAPEMKLEQVYVEGRQIKPGR